MKQIIKYFLQQGGFRLIKEYLLNGVLVYSLTHLLLHGFSKKSLELLRIAVDNKLQDKINRRYRDTLQKVQSNQCSIPSRIIWIFWLQGLENAPQIVQKCYNSVCRHLSDSYQIILLTSQNRKNYITLPEVIERKFSEGKIGYAHFSDILRVSLLTEYGGTWIDATVFITGRIPSSILDADFFVFQNLSIDAKDPYEGISNWFISAKKGNRIVQAIRDLLCLYWTENDRAMSYFVFHNMMAIIKDEWPEEWNKIMKLPNSVPHILQLKLFENYDSRYYDVIKSLTPIHKLTYKISQDNQSKLNTYFEQVINS